MNIDLIAQLKTYDEFIAAYKDGDENKLYDGKSLMHYAVANNDPSSRYKITSFLLDKGAQVESLNSEGQNLLHILLSRQNHNLEQTLVLFKQLIVSGANINQLDKKKRLPIQHLLFMGFSDDELEPFYDIWFSQPEVILDVPNAWGLTPIQFAEKHPRRVKILKRLNDYLEHKGL